MMPGVVCTALFLNEIYLPMKFHVDALQSFKVILWTNKRAQRALGRSPEEKVKGQGEAIILI